MNPDTWQPRPRDAMYGHDGPPGTAGSLRSTWGGSEAGTYHTHRVTMLGASQDFQQDFNRLFSTDMEGATAWLPDPAVIPPELSDSLRREATAQYHSMGELGMQRLLSTAQGQQRRLVSMDGGGGGSPPHAALDGGMQRPLTTEVGRGVSRAEGSPVRANGGNGVAAPSGGMLGVLTRLNTQQAQPRFSAGGSQRLQYRQYDEDDELPRPSTVDPSWGGQGYAAYVPPSTAPGFVPGDASQPRPQSSAPRSTSGSAEWRHSMTTMEHAVLPVPMPSSPQRMRQATATQATRPLTKGLVVRSYHTRAKAYDMHATFTVERLPHIPRLSSPPPRGRPASRGAPSRNSAASPRTDTSAAAAAAAAASSSQLRGSTPATVRGSLTSPLVRTPRGGAALAFKAEPKRRPSSVSGALPPQENASAYSVESDDDDAFLGLAETEHEREFGQHVQRRMQIMPLMHCKAPNGEAMSITMPKWASMKAHEAWQMETLDDALSSDLRLIDGAIAQCNIFAPPMRIPGLKGYTPPPQKKALSARNSPERQRTISNAKHGFAGIEQFMAKQLEKYPKAEKEVKKPPTNLHTDWIKVPNVFDGRSAGRENNRDEVYRFLDIKLLVNDDGARQTSRHDLDPQTGVALYERECKARGCKVLTRVVEMLDQQHALMRDCHLNHHGGMALARALATNSVIRRVDLRNNGLTGEALVAVLGALATNVHIEEVDLSGNSFTAVKGHVPAKALAALLRVKGIGIQRLALNGCSIADEVVRHIAPVLQNFNKSISILELAHNQIGDNGASVFGDMLQYNQYMAAVDMSNNHIKAMGAKGLSAGLVHNQALRYLNMASNGLGEEGCSYFANTLRVNAHLKQLDLRKTRCGPEACLVFCDALKHNSGLHTLHLGGNPCGEDGGRHLMVMLQTNDVIQCLTLDGCTFNKRMKVKKPPAKEEKSGGKKGKKGKEKQAEAPKEDKARFEFNRNDADGEHELDLALMGDRAILGQLLTLEATNPGSVLDCKVNGKKMAVGELESAGWFKGDMPMEGKCWINFKAKMQGEPIPLEAIEEDDLDNLCNQLSSGNMSDVDRVILSQMFATTYKFWAKQAGMLLECFEGGEEKDKAAVMLFFSVLDNHNTRHMLPLDYEHKRLLVNLGTHASFRTSNSTGRYRLDLAIASDRMMAINLVESAISENGNRAWRNVTLNKRPLKPRTGAPPEWLGNKVPTNGVLELDYVSSAMPPAGTVAADDETLVELLWRNVVNPHTGRLEGPDVVWRLREHSIFMWVSAEQARDIITQFVDHAERVEAAVILRSRIVDQANLYKVLYALHMVEQQFFCTRLGPTNVINHEHPTMRYRLRTNDYEHFGVAKELADVAASDSGKNNWHGLYVNGKFKTNQVTENNKMLGIIMGIEQPALEFDFAGPDIWALLAKEEPTDRRARDVYLKRYAERRVFKRMLFLHRQWKLVLGRLKAEAMASAPPIKAQKGKGKSEVSAVMLAFGMDVHQVKSEAPKLEDLYATQEAEPEPELYPDLSTLKNPLTHSRSVLARNSSGKARAAEAKRQEAERDAAMKLKLATKASHSFKGENGTPLGEKEPEEVKPVSNFLKLLQAKQNALSTFVNRFKAKVKEQEEKKTMSWLKRMKSDNKQAETSLEGEKSRRNHAWQQSWDQMLIDLVQEEATFRDVELSDKFKPPLQMFFEKMDKDQKGFLTRDEFIEGMQTECSMADVVSKTELEQWFDETDVTGDKEVSWEEFEALCLDKLTFHSDYLGVDDV